VTDVYLPLAGTIVLAPSTLAAMLDHARGRRLDADQRTTLDALGLTVDGRLDPPIEPVASTLLSGGPRCHLLSRACGRLTVVDTALAPDRNRAAVLTRPPGSPVVHVQALSLGAATRHLARLVGLGPHVLARPPFDRPLELRDWTVVRSGFDSAAPSGWVGRRERAELHELRWVRTPGDRPGTALVVARLDGGLAEVRPSVSCEGAYTVTSADSRAVWSRLCALTSTCR
jgi:hypothetical protein